MVRRRRSAATVLVAALAVAACSSGRAADPVDTLSGIPGATSVVGNEPPSTAVLPSTAAATTPPPPPPPPTAAATTTPPTPPPTAAPTTEAPAPPTTTFPAVDAAAYVVYDMRSGEVLAAKRRNARMPVGSLMKLLTAHVAYAAGQPAKIVTVPENPLIDPEESNIGLIPGEEFQRDLLIRAMLIVSANDAARALAADIAGGEAPYAEMMNSAAGELGLGDTRAANVTGLDAEGQYSSAMDMVRLGAGLMANPTFQLTVNRVDAVLHDLRHPSTNDLLTLYPGADGIKSGRTTQAGWCLLGSASREGRRIVVAVLGAPTEAARNAATVALLDWGFAR